MKKRGRYISGFFLVWFVTHTAIILVDGLTDDNQKSDLGVIFGNKVNPDGTLSERLMKRCDKGVELYKDSLIARIVVSGGLGKEGYEEGTKMYEYLLSKGVPPAKILIDNNGNTTEATVTNVKKMNLNPHSITVITQYYHVSRAKLAFRKAGFKNVYGTHAAYLEFRDGYSIVREFFGFYNYLLLSNIIQSG